MTDYQMTDDGCYEFNKDFSNTLRKWLNDRDFVEGDWPHNVPEAVRLEADAAFGGGALLDEDGWPMRAQAGE